MPLKFPKPSPALLRVLTWLVSLAIPVFLALGVVRLLLYPWYVEFEYRTPGFPPDQYGFTLEERLSYSKTAIEYLLNDADISFLGDLRFPDGQIAPDFSCQFMEDCTRLYNERELSHMVDVKVVVQAALRIWVGSFIWLALAGLWAWLAGWLEDYRHALRRGGWLTLPIIGGIIIFVLLAFGVIFVLFHEIFFASGTWTFYFSDTLIRLFPERFWRDTFLMVGALTGLGGLILALGLRRLNSRPRN
jgi:integral membrane protein (TIGR01906 family)